MSDIVKKVKTFSKAKTLFTDFPAVRKESNGP